MQVPSPVSWSTRCWNWSKCPHLGMSAIKPERLKRASQYPMYNPPRLYAGFPARQVVNACFHLSKVPTYDVRLSPWKVVRAGFPYENKSQYPMYNPPNCIRFPPGQAATRCWNWSKVPTMDVSYLALKVDEGTIASNLNTLEWRQAFQTSIDAHEPILPT
jgi:hypothetical protein